MCGRYELIDGQRIFVRFRVSNAPPGTNPTLPPLLRDNADVRPTQQVPVLLTDRVLTRMQWGIIPAWSSSKSDASSTTTKPIINARAEGIETKPTFRRLLPSQRCLIPASAFFEWMGPSGPSAAAPGARGEKKIKYRIARHDGDLFAFAGLYQVMPMPTGDGELHTCTIITTVPNAVVAPIHNRMPVMLLPDDEDRWLDPDLTEPDAIISLLRPYPADLMVARPA